MSIRVGIVGLESWYSGRFAAAIQKLGPTRAELAGAAYLGIDDTSLVNLTGSTREQFRERFGTPLFDNVQDMLGETQPDLVFVTAQNLKKPEYVALCLEAGADVFTSKPTAASPTGAARILDLSRAHSTQLVGTLNPARFATAIREGHRRVAAGEIGDVLTARAWVQHGAPDPSQSRRGHPEMDDGQAGPEYSLGVYTADLLNWFVEARKHPPVRAFAEYGTLNSPGWPWMDSGKAVTRYGNDRIGSMDIIFTTPCPAPLWEIEVVGSDGILRTNGSNYEGMIWRRKGLERPTIEPYAPTVEDVILSTVTHVIDCCVHRTPFEMDAEDGYRAIELCEAWKQSATSNLPVRLPLEAPRPAPGESRGFS